MTLAKDVKLSTIDDLLAAETDPKRHLVTREVLEEEVSRLFEKFKAIYGFQTHAEVDEAVNGPLHLTELADLWISWQDLRPYFPAS